MFYKPYNIFAYVISFILLSVGILFDTNFTVIVAVVMFFLWDFIYLKSSESMWGRSIDQALQQTQNIREHISYFLAFYGVLFAILFTQSTEKQTQFLEVCEKSGIPVTLLILPFLLASVSLLFFPIQSAFIFSDSISTAQQCLTFKFIESTGVVISTSTKN